MGHYLKQELYELVKKDSRIFDFIQEGSLDGMWYWDLEKPENEWMSPKFWTELGYDPEKMPHKASAWQDIINQDDLKLAVDNFNKHCADANHPYDQTVRYKHKNGSTVYIRCRGLAIRNDNGQPIRMLGAHTNVTKLNESSELLFKLTQHVPGVIYQYRYHPDGRNYFPYASEKIWDIYEVTPEQVKEDASLVLSRLHPDDYQAVMDSIVESYETLGIWEFKYRVLLPENGLRWLYGQAQPEKLDDGSVLWHGYIQDVTQKHEAELALKESEKRFRSVFENSPLGKSLTTPEGRLRVNKKFSEITGYSEEELNKLNWKDITHPEDLQISIDSVEKMKNTQDAVYFRKRYIKKNGEYVWTQVTSVKDIDPVSNKEYFLTALEDISDLVKYEENLIKTNKELEQFTYITSHDLQEPLNSIIAFSNLLEDEKDKMGEIGQKSIEVIRNSSFRMKDFITSLLEFSRIGRQKVKTEIDIQNLIDNLKIDLTDLIEKKEASINYIGKPLKLMVFEPDFIKLLQNLVINGIKYTNENTKPFIVINAEEQTASYKFSVSDNGIGISEEYFEKIFEVFQRLHSRHQYSGTGIGLSHSKKVVELHGGEIWLTSEEGKGTTFYFTISKQ